MGQVLIFVRACKHELPQQKWVADLANWTLGAAGIYATTLIANLDKLRRLLKPNWLSWTIIFLALSALIGVVTRLFLGWSDTTGSSSRTLPTMFKLKSRDFDYTHFLSLIITDFGNMLDTLLNVFVASTKHLPLCPTYP